MGSRRHRATLAHEYILPLLRTMINQFPSHRRDAAPRKTSYGLRSPRFAQRNRAGNPYRKISFPLITQPTVQSSIINHNFLL